MEFSNDVIEAIQANKKILAIKCLRMETGMGLKEAKEAVEQYIYEHPEVKASMSHNNPLPLPTISTLVVLVMLGVIIYFLFFDK